MTAKKRPPRKKAPAKKPEAKKPHGRPSAFTQKVADIICERLADGESLRAICADKGMPHRATVFRWLSEYAKFRDQYAHARDAQADALADDIVQIADESCTTVRADKHGTKDDDGEGNTEVVFDSAAVARNRLRVDARKWLAGKLKPKKYGERVNLEHEGRLTLEQLVTGVKE